MAHPGDQHRVGSYVNQQKGKFEHGPSSASGSRENQTKNHDTIPANVGVEQRDHGTMYSKTEDLHRSADGASAKNMTSRKETNSYLIRDLFESENYYKMCYVFDSKHRKEDLKSALSEHRYESIKMGELQGLIVPSSVEKVEVEKHLLPLIHGLIVCKLQYNGNKDSKMRFCLDICAKEPDFRDEIVKIFQEESDDRSILIVGPREECKKAEKYVEMELKEREKLLKEAQSTSPRVSPVLLDDLDMLILDHTVVLHKLKALSSHVNLDYDRKRQCINIVGLDYFQRMKACEDVKDFLHQHKNSRVVWKNPAIFTKLLQMPHVKMYLSKQFEAEAVACHWLCHEKEINIFSTSKEMSEKFLCLMKDCLKHDKCRYDANISYILTNECTDFEDKMVWEEDENIIRFAATCDIFDKFTEHVKSKCKESKVEIVSDSLHRDFFKEELEGLQKNVHIEDRDDKLLVSGVKPDVLEAEQKIRDLLSKIKERQMVVFGEEEISTLRRHYKVGSKTVEETNEARVLMSISDPDRVMNSWREVEYGNGKCWIFPDGRTVVLQLAKWQDCDAEIVISFQQETKKQSDRSAKYMFCFEKEKNDDRDVFNLYLPPLGDGRNNEAKKLEETMIIISQDMKGGTLRSLGVPLDQAHLVHWKGKFLMKRVLYCFAKEKNFSNVSKLFFTHQSIMDLQTYRDAIQDALEGCTYQTDFHCDRNFTLEVREASLVDAKVDVLVNTTDKQMNLEQGVVSKLILNKCGDELKEECARHHSKQLVYGEVVVTGTGKGREYGWKKILHGALPRWTDSENISVLVHFVAECLRHASDLGLQSIAFPAIGTGQLGYPKNEAAKAIMTGILDYRKAYPQKSPRQILLTLFDKKDVQIFKGELSTQLKRRKIKVTDVGGCITFDIRPSLQLILTQTDIRVHAVDCLVVFWCQDETHKANRPESVFNKEYLKETGKVLSDHFLSKRAYLQSRGCITTDECLPYGRIVHQAINMSDFTGSVAKGLAEASKCGSRRVGIVISYKDQTSSQLENWSCAIHAGATRLAKQQNGVTVREIIVSCEDILFSKSVHYILQRHSKENQTVPTSKHTPELCCEIRILGTSEDAVKEKEKQIRAIINPTGTEGASSSKEANVTTVTDESSNENTGKAPSRSNDGNKTPRKRKELTLTEEEKCCLLVHCKMDESSRHTMQKKQLEEQLTKTHKTEFSRFVYPFLDAGQGLLKFHTSVDAKKFLTESSKEDMFIVEAFPPQAVNNIEAKLSADVQKVLVDSDMTKDSIEENTGAVLQMNGKTWVLTGNLLEIKVAEKYIKEQIHNHSSNKRKENKDFNANQSTRTPSPPRGARRKTSASVMLSDDKSLRTASSSSSSTSSPSSHWPQQMNESKMTPEREDTVFVSRETYNILKHMNKQFPWKDIEFWEREQGIQLSIPHSLMESFHSALKKADTLFTDYITLQEHDSSFELAACISELEAKTNEIYIRKETYKITIKGVNKNGVQQTKERIETVISNANQRTRTPSPPRGARRKTTASVMLSDDKSLRTASSSSSSPSSPSAHWPEQMNESKMTPEQEDEIVFVSKETYNILKHMNKQIPWENFKRSEGEQEIQLSVPYSKMESFHSAKREAETLSTEEIILQEQGVSIEHATCISKLEAETSKIYIKQEPYKITVKGINQKIVRQTKERIEEVIYSKERWQQQSKSKGRGSHLYPVKQLEEIGQETAGSRGSRSVTSQKQAEAENVKMKPPNNAKILLGSYLPVYVYRGDICQLYVDCIVNPTNESLDSTSGISGYIMHKVGENVAEALKIHYKDSGPMKLGKVLHTHGGSSGYEHIFHISCPKWTSYCQSSHDIQRCEQDLNMILKEIIRKTAEKHYLSIGIPVIGTGFSGIPEVLCANSFAKSMKEVSKTKSKSPAEIHIVNMKDDIVNLLRVAFKEPIPWLFQRHNGDGVISLCSDLKVHIYQGFFMNADTQAVAVSEGEEFNGSRWAVKQLYLSLGKGYQDSHMQLKKSKLPVGNKCVLCCEGDYPGVSFKKVLHVILPVQKEWKTFETAYRKGIQEMLKAAEKLHVHSLAMPFIGGGSKDPNYQTGCAAVLAEELLQFSQKNKTYLRDIHIVNGDKTSTSGSKSSSTNQLLIKEFRQIIEAKYSRNNNLIKYLSVNEPFWDKTKGRYQH